MCDAAYHSEQLRRARLLQRQRQALERLVVRRPVSYTLLCATPPGKPVLYLCTQTMAYLYCCRGSFKHRISEIQLL